MSSDFIKLYVHQGDSETWNVVSSDSPTLDLSGATFRGDIRKEYNTDVLGSFTFEEVDYSLGQFNIKLDATTSASLPIPGKNMAQTFVFDIQYIQGSPENVTTMMHGHLVVQREVTR